MTAPLIAAALTPTVRAAAPAGLTEAQTLAHKRLQTARDAMAALTPLDPEYLADEAAWERHRRWNGEDQ